MKKLKNYLAILMLPLLIPTTIKADGVDEEAAKALITQYTTPITNVLLWAVPIVIVIACTVSFIKWISKDEREREQQSWFKDVKYIIIAGIIVESISAILKVFGLA